MKKTTIMMSISLLVAASIIGKAFILNEDSLGFLLILFSVGTGLGLLRLFVNRSIKKMKGKGWLSKVLFFGVLLGVGLPFQNWFRKNVLLSIDSSYFLSSIIILIVGILFMTAFSKYISNKFQTKSVTN